MINTRHKLVSGPTSWALVFAFAAIYFIWGSTYLGILVAIETIPPFTMIGTRFALAGALMYGWLRLRGHHKPTRSQWGSAALMGGLMLSFGTGSVAWAEQYVPSGLAALLITTVPIWMVLLDWLWKGGQRPSGKVVVGLLLGLVGVVLLVDPVALLESNATAFFPMMLILLGAIGWSVGSIHSRGADLPDNPFLSTAMQMLTGGMLLVVFGLGMGEWNGFDVAAISLRSFLGWSYLVIFGSFIAFSAYVWLLKNVSPARVSTYAYVNPVVAVLLGWALADEVLNLRILIAVILLVSAVILITRRSKGRVKKVVSEPVPSQKHVGPYGPRRVDRPANPVSVASVEAETASPS